MPSHASAGIECGGSRCGTNSKDPQRIGSSESGGVGDSSTNAVDVTASPADFFKPEDNTMESSAEFAKPVYLVAVLADEQSAYSILKIDAGGGDGEPPRARVVARLPGEERGMSFVAAHSKHGSWIVGVGGGPSAATVIFEPSTLKTIKGHRLRYPKHEPVLISHGGEVYAISRRPRVVPRIDNEPWFESLSFNEGVPSGDRGVLPWTMLPPPPFFPARLNPHQFRNPPEITVTSYAAMDSYVLLSPQQELTVGAYAFHVVNKTWEKVHNKNLPFVGQAVPLGGGAGDLFAACPVSKNGVAASASVFRMSIDLSSSSTPSLSIQEFPVATSEDKIPWPLFCPLGEGSFCSIRLGSVRPSRRKANCLKKVQVILTTFQMENFEAIFMARQSQGVKAKDLPDAARVQEQGHTCKFKGRKRLLECDMPLVAALSMITENIELFEEDATCTIASRPTESSIFEAPVIYG
ncbi:uncharacterized protein [Lolium perenne]|uniref:uncharacterized protein n=1 Tax=Lolium perenne TaxID=4522 RepID=UPI003A998DDC